MGAGVGRGGGKKGSDLGGVYKTLERGGKNVKKGGGGKVSFKNAAKLAKTEVERNFVRFRRNFVCFSKNLMCFRKNFMCFRRYFVYCRRYFVFVRRYFIFFRRFFVSQKVFPCV